MTDDKLELYRNNTAALEERVSKEENQWNNVLKELSKSLKGAAKNLYLVDADVVNYRQIVTSEIQSYSLLIYKENRVLKPLIKRRFEWYSTKYQINVKSSSDKMKLIESDVADIQYRIDVLDNHVDFLRSTSDNLRQMGYSVKNRLELLNILGLD